VETTTRRIAHVQIDNDLGRASGGLLHSAEIVNPGQTFQGTIYAQPAAEATVRGFLGPGRTVYIGRGRTRGQGRVRLNVYESRDQSGGELLQRLKELNQKAASFPTVAALGGVWFTVTLHSPGVAFDRWLLSRGYFTAGDLSDQLADYRLRAFFSRPATVSGWHAKAGLPKSETLAIAPGSAFLFWREWSNEGTRPAELERIAPILEKIQTRGVGERLQEGFGELIACDPFHFENAAQEGE
jgi:CRISPR-associated protein Csx10